MTNADYSILKARRGTVERLHLLRKVSHKTGFTLSAKVTFMEYPDYPFECSGEAWGKILSVGPRQEVGVIFGMDSDGDMFIRDFTKI